MSHITTVKSDITDVAAVKALCAELGWALQENATEYRGWYGMQPCTHAIALPEHVTGKPLDIGLIHDPQTGRFTLAYDHFLENDYGKNRPSPIGRGAKKLMQLYATHKAVIEAKKRGLIVTRRVVPGTQKIELTCTGI
jgi:hypothetical protein